LHVAEAELWIFERLENEASKYQEECVVSSTSMLRANLLARLTASVQEKMMLPCIKTEN
jgi:hypothetical protein